MNYLAHVYLARPSAAARLGALLGDFARGLDLARLPPEVRAAVLEHRAVDAFVDGHTWIRRERTRFPPELRRFAGILLDVFHDHFLVRHWARFSDEPLERVTESLYRAFREYASILPPRLAEVAPRMASQDWLASYGELENVDRALAGIARRVRRETAIARGGDELRARYRELEEGFLALFPEVLAYVARRRGQEPTGARGRDRPRSST